MSLVCSIKFKCRGKLESTWSRSAKTGGGEDNRGKTEASKQEI